MPISRTRKEELLAHYKEILSNSNGFAVVSVERLSVIKTQALRKKIQEAGGQYVVAKNTLVRIALEQSGWSVPTDALEGPTAIAFGTDNFPAVAKAILEFIKLEDNAERIAIKGGVMGGKEVLTSVGVEAVSNLPTLPELQSQIIGLIVAPSRNIVTILQNAESGVVNVLQALLDKGA